MIKYSLYITEKQDQELRKIAEESTTTVSEVIRVSINKHLRDIEQGKVALSPSMKESKNE